MAKLATLKTQLEIESLDLQRTVDEKQQPTQWLRYWNDQRRIAVVVHDDVVAAIKANPNLDTLALKYEQKVTKTGKSKGTVYEQYILINAKSIEVVL